MSNSLEGEHDDGLSFCAQTHWHAGGFCCQRRPLFACPSHTSSEPVRQLPQGSSLQEFGLILVGGRGREGKSEGRPRVEPVDENGRHTGLRFLKAPKGNSELQSSIDSICILNKYSYQFD